MKMKAGSQAVSRRSTARGRMAIMMEFRDQWFEENSVENKLTMHENRETGNDKNRKQGRGGKGRKVFKKIGVLTLSAVLFGGIAAGTFQGVNYLTGYAQRSEESPVSSGEDSTSRLLNVNTVSGSSEKQTGSMDVSAIAEAAMPSIVSITNRSVQEVESYFQTFGYSFQQPQQEETESCGSGIIIGQNDTELLIVTNNHVVEGADTLTVSFVDNEVYEANLKGTDASNDLAVIAVPLESISDDTMSKISVAVIGNSDELKVGEQVAAIGNALGYGQSVTTGIVSATDRVISTSTEDGSTSTEANTYIQTDAAINPGNSGGALLNMNGELIGINSAKLASTEVEGMGYAIPISRVYDIIETLMNEPTRTKVEEGSQGTLDIQCGDFSSQAAQAYGIPQGVYVADVTSGGAADQAGISAGSIITEFDGRSVTSTSELKEALSYYSAGETVNVTVYRPNAQQSAYEQSTVSVTLGGSHSGHTA